MKPAPFPSVFDDYFKPGHKWFNKVGSLSITVTVPSVNNERQNVNKDWTTEQ